MKILFTADIHIKLGQKNVPIEWAKNRYRLLINQLQNIQNDCDMVVIGGDIFDRVPTMEELEVYYDLVESIKIPCYIYSGNHESLKKHTTFLTYLKKVTNNLNNLVTIIDDYLTVGSPEGEPLFNIVPYNKLKEFEKNSDIAFEYVAPLLFTHVRGEIPPHVKPEVDLDIFNKWNTVLAGDLHAYENSQRNILYPGSPITTSFHRARVDTGIIIYNTDTTTHSWIPLELPQLIRKNIQAGEPMLQTEYDHTIYEVEGDMTDLSALEDNDLIDKKVMKRNTDVSLILLPDMTLQEEVSEYLLYILELDEDKVPDILHLLNEYMDKIND